jgi:gliding motility-associated-like protein
MKTPLVLLISLLSFTAYSQGSGNTVYFDGIDDYVDLGNIYDDLTYPFSISSWVYFGSGDTGGPVFVSQDNSAMYNGFWFYVTPTRISIEYGDGFGENHPAFRRGLNATISNISNRWTHVAAVVNGIDNIDLYVNGVNVGGDITGDSPNPMSSNFPGDVAKIGYFLSNSVTYRFKGAIDDLRVYNKSLSASEIRQNMCQQIAGNLPGLIGYWSFDGTSSTVTEDLSPNDFDGTFNGNPQRKYSGAPIGEVSAQLYTSSWTGVTVALESLTAKNISAGVSGIHLYKVNQLPSQSGGLPAGTNSEYYGVFLASATSGKQFSIEYAESCDHFLRIDNSVSTWNTATSLTNINDRIELITSPGDQIEVDLGDDRALCENNSLYIQSEVDPVGKLFSWNTNETTPGIWVTASGQYILTVTGTCSAKKDTLNIIMKAPPESFSLGNDMEVCSVLGLTLNVPDDIDADITWSDGSGELMYTVKDFGTHWVEAQNQCGLVRDTIAITSSITKHMIPNVITPNGDTANEFFVVEPALEEGSNIQIFNRWGKRVFYSSNYANDWSGAGLSAGIYFYVVTTNCEKEFSGALTILK